MSGWNIFFSPQQQQDVRCFWAISSNMTTHSPGKSYTCYLPSLNCTFSKLTSFVTHTSQWVNEPRNGHIFNSTVFSPKLSLFHSVYFIFCHICIPVTKPLNNTSTWSRYWDTESLYLCRDDLKEDQNIFVIVWNNVWFRHLFQSWSGLTFPSTFLSIPQPHGGNVYDHHPHDQMSLLDTTKAGCLDIICRRLPGTDQIRHAEKTLFQARCKRATENKDRTEPLRTDTTSTTHFHQ